MDIEQLDVFDDTPTRVVCMDEYLALIAEAVAPDIPISVTADATEGEGEIPIHIEGEAVA